jgi:hypothetical protein
MCESSQCQITMIYTQYQQQLEDNDRRAGIVRSRWVHFPDGRSIRRNDANNSATKVQALFRGYSARKFSAKGTMPTRSGNAYSPYVAGPSVNRQASATRIQSVFRGYIDRRNVKAGRMFQKDVRQGGYTGAYSIQFVPKQSSRCPPGFKLRQGCGFPRGCYGKKGEARWIIRSKGRTRCPKGYRKSKSKYGGCNKKKRP